jgi:hypothetical protein
MADLEATMLNVAAGVMTGLITAAASVRFSLNRFRSERMWDRKVAAYTDIMESLYVVQKYARMELQRWEEGAEFDETHRKELARQSALAYEAIRKASIKGTLLVGAAAAKRLEELVTAFDDPHYNEDPVDEISSNLETATKAIEDLRALAEADLRAR